MNVVFEGSGETIELAHLTRSSVVGAGITSSSTWKTVSKGQILGTLYEGVLNELPCGATTGTHVHMSFKSLPSTLDGVTFSYTSHSRFTPTAQSWLTSHNKASATSSISPLTLSDRAAATGDFNGDGFDDLAVGVPGEDIGSIADAGQVNISYGTASGLPSTGGQSLYQKTSDGESHGLGGAAEAGDRAGASLASGDFNGDGFDDLAVGVPGEDIGSIADAGQVNISYGTASGLPSTGGQSLYQKTSDGATHGLGGAVEKSDLAGSSVAVGDVNGDGFDDLVAGVPGEDIGSVADAGQVSIAHGSSAGLPSTGGGSRYGVTSDDETHGLGGYVEKGDYLGASVAIGDVNGDGFDDLVAGVPGEDIGSVADAGQVSIAHGSSAGLPSTGGASRYQATSDGATHGLGGKAEKGDYVGGAPTSRNY